MEDHFGDRAWLQNFFLFGSQRHLMQYKQKSLKLNFYKEEEGADPTECVQEHDLSSELSWTVWKYHNRS